MHSSRSRAVRYLAFVACFILTADAGPCQAGVCGAAHDAHEMSGHMTMTGAASDAAGRQGARRRDRGRSAQGCRSVHGLSPRRSPTGTQSSTRRSSRTSITSRTTHVRFRRLFASILHVRRRCSMRRRVRAGKPGYKLVGVMYTAPYRASEEELNRRVPLSIARWHLHTNLCLPPAGGKADVLGTSAKFGLQGSIITAQACGEAGGTFLPHIFGWMVHVYPFMRRTRQRSGQREWTTNTACSMTTCRRGWRCRC